MPVPWKTSGALHGQSRRISGFENRAITLRQLRDLSILLQRLCKTRLLRRTTEFSKHNGAHGAPIHWFDINMYDIRDELITKLIPYLDPECPADPQTQQRWYSWVELVAERKQPPTLFFSHWWGGRFRDFVCMAEAALQEKRLGIHTGIWVCTFALCQFGEDLGPSLAECPFVQGFREATSVVFVVDRDAGSLRRTWCGFELQLTAESEKHLDLYTPTGRVGSQRASSGPLVDAVATWDIRRTETTEECDRRQILNRVAGVPEFVGIVQEGHAALLQNGRKSLENRSLVGTSGRRRLGSGRHRLGGQLEWAHEAGLFEDHRERFDRLNAMVRDAVMSSIGRVSVSSGCKVEDSSLRGISLGQLRSFAREIRKQCELGWPTAQAVPDYADPRQTTWETLIGYDVIHWLVRPLCAEKGCSYLELVSQHPQPPQVYISQSWKNRFADTMSTVEWLAEARHLTDSTAVFIDMCCLTQTVETVPDEVFQSCMHESSELLVCCSTARESMNTSWIYYEVLQFTRSGKSVTFGCNTGVLACNSAFRDGGHEFGTMDPDIARLLCSVRIEDASTFYLPAAEELNFVKDAIAASFEGLDRAEAFARFEQRLQRLAAGPVLRAAALDDDTKEIRQLCRCPGLLLSSPALAGALGETALHVAAAAGRLGALSALLELRAPPDAQDHAGETPLHYAAMAGQHEAARALLAAGADPACESCFGETPLEVARQELAGFLGVSTARTVDVLSPPPLPAP